MKKILFHLITCCTITLSIIFIIASCKKSSQVEQIEQKGPPIANAGRDTTIFLPSNTVILNGSASHDPGGHISSFLWTKISGPSDFILGTPNAAQTTADSLKKGVYQFELKVTDAEGLFDKDTVQIEVRPEIKPQNLGKGNVCFFLPDPTGTISYINESFDSPEPNLFAVTINNLSDTLSGVWGSNYSPRCPIETDYYVEPGVTCLTFDLSPGTYNWTAKSLICNLSTYPEVSGSFIQYFLTSHSTSGTITVNPGSSCIIQKIVF
jgi:hypothetical protein